MKVRIIKLKKIHLDLCFDLDQKSLKGLWTKTQWEKELTDPKRICLGALDFETKELLGLSSGWLVLDELQITSIAVHPQHLRKGLGKIILSNLIKRCKHNGIKNIYLEVKDTNEPAKAFYKSMGFEITGNRSNFYKDGSNALIYSKELTIKTKKIS